MIVITGAAGFIGSVIAKHLNGKGINNLILVDKFSDGEKWKNLTACGFSDFIDRDVFIKNLESVEYRDCIEAIIHMGACTDTSEFDMDYLLNTNYEYSKKLCRFALNKGIRFIYASSAAVYGDGTLGFSDDDALTPKLKPLNPYGFSKWMFDEWLIKNGLNNDVTGLRFFNVYGPNEYHKDAMASVICRYFKDVNTTGIYKLFKSYKKGIADGAQERDFIYVKDVAEVVSFFVEHKDINGIFNLGTGKARTFNDLAKSVLEALGKPVKIEYFDMPAEIRDKYQYFTEADMKKLRNAGYKKEFTSLEKGIKEYIQNYLLSGSYY